MTRNLDNRVEAITPIDDSRLQCRLDGILETLLSDDQNRWVMRSDGTYDRCQPTDDGPTTNVHETLMRSALDDVRHNTRP